MNVDGPLNAGDRFYGWGCRFTLLERGNSPYFEQDLRGQDIWPASELSSTGLREVYLTEEFIRDALTRETPTPRFQIPPWNGGGAR